MLIKLIPVPPHPSVLFAITFANAPFAYSPDKPNASVPEEVFSETSLVIPAGWAVQLGTLAADDLDLPTALHALDCAAGIPTLLQEITLDVPSCTIRCSFIDGSVEEWAWPSNVLTSIPLEKRPVALRGPAAMQRYMDMLDSVIRDVNQSAIEDERDRQKELFSIQQQQQEQQGRRSSASDSSRPASPKPALKTHKKQRSFFMNFVASIVNLTPSGIHLQPRPSLPPSPKRSPSPISIPISNSPPPTPTCLRSPFPPLWSPPNYTMRQTLRTLGSLPSAGRTLRWHARSTLVDVFRRFVLPEIAARSSYATYHNYHATNLGICGIDGTGKVAAGYYVWSIESMLRRASQRMDDLANATAANGVVTDRDRDRKLKSRIFPRFSVPRRKETPKTAVGHYRRSAETRAEQERDRQEAEYFATTTQSMQSPHLFSDEEDSTEDGRSIPCQQKDNHASSEDGDADTIETDTDGSSVHTPSSGHESFVFPPTTTKSSRQSKLPLLVSPKHTRNVSQITSSTSIQVKGTLLAEGPAPGSLSPIEMAEYKSLSRLVGKLQHLLFSARERTSQAEREARQRDATLEVKSKRRAWLNRALRSHTPNSAVRGGQNNDVVAYGYIATSNMSRPSTSSPLTRWTWTSEDWDYDPDTSVEDDVIILQEQARFSAGDESDQVVAFGYQLRRTSSRRDGVARGEAMLFPVIEEDEEPSRDIDTKIEHKDEELLIRSGIGDCDELRELELGLAGFNLDVEAEEMSWTGSDNIPTECGINPNVVSGPGIKVASEPERPRVRVRTSSMYEQQAPFGRSQLQRPLNSPTDQKASSKPGLTSSSLLCQPLATTNSSNGDHNSARAVFTPPLIEKSETPMICASFAGEIRDSDEFTLSMDLPPPIKGRSNISTFSNIPVAQSLTIFAPSPQCGRQAQLTTVPDAR